MSSVARPGGRHGAGGRASTASPPIRVLLADPHPRARAGLRVLVEGEPDLCVVGEVERADALLTGCRQGCDVVVLDVRLPGARKLELVRCLRRTWPAVAIVLLATCADGAFGAMLLAEGASAYLAKDGPADDVVAAIRAVHAGRRWPAESAPAPVAGGPPHRRLGPREYQVFTLLLLGRTADEIAGELALAIGAVAEHLARIEATLAARSIADILGYARRAGLVGDAREGAA